MRIDNGYYKAIDIAWSTITLPLKEGTPISLDGEVANTADAIGIVPQTIKQRPLMDSIMLLVGGDVELAEVNASFGSELTAAAKGSMSAIRFWTADGTPDDSADNTPAAATTETAGTVKQAANIPELTSDSSTIALLRADVNTLLEALKEAGIMEADPEPEPDPDDDSGEDDS